MKYIACSPDPEDPALNNILPLNKGITYELFLNEKIREGARKKQSPREQNQEIENLKTGSALKTEPSNIVETKENEKEMIMANSESFNEFNFVIYSIFWNKNILLDFLKMRKFKKPLLFTFLFYLNKLNPFMYIKIFFCFLRLIINQG